MVGVAVKRTMYQRKVDVDMLNAVKSMLADVSSVRPSSEQSSMFLPRLTILFQEIVLLGNFTFHLKGVVGIDSFNIDVIRGKALKSALFLTDSPRQQI